MKMTINVTDKCNMNCDYCFRGKDKGRSATFDIIKAAIAMSMASDRSTSINFFGGEPLIERALIEETLNYARSLHLETKHNFYFRITTNGTLVDEDLLRTAQKHRLLIAVSHDGLMLESGRKYIGNTELDENKLRLILSYQPFASVLSVVTPKEVGKFAESVEWLFDLGFRNLFPSPQYGKHADWDKSSLAVLKKEYKKIATLYKNWTKSGAKFYLGPFEEKILSHIKGEDYVAERCNLGKDHLTIAPDGRIYPCVQFADDERFYMGNVFEGIDKDVQEKFSAKRIVPDGCSNCAIKNRCRHTCGCLNKQETGDINQVSPMQCRHEQILIKTVDVMAEQLYRSKNQRFLRKHYDPYYPIISIIEDLK